jgi:hypothetical protein
MPARLSVPVSQRDAFYWQLHVLLDHVATTERFVDELLSKIELEGTKRVRVSAALRVRLPAEVDEIDVRAVATALEENDVLRWMNDLRSRPSDDFRALEAAVTAILRSAPRGAMPRPTADALVAETSRVLRDLVDDAMARALHGELLSILQRDLWRRDTAERQLVDTICSAVAKHVRITPA